MFSYTLFVSFSSEMEYAILLSTSLGHGVMKPMEPVFFYPFICIALAHTANASANASHDSVFTLAFAFAFECVDVVHACIFLLLHLCVNQA